VIAESEKVALVIQDETGKAYEYDRVFGKHTAQVRLRSLSMCVCLCVLVCVCVFFGIEIVPRASDRHVKFIQRVIDIISLNGNGRAHVLANHVRSSGETGRQKRGRARILQYHIRVRPNGFRQVVHPLGAQLFDGVFFRRSEQKPRDDSPRGRGTVRAAASAGRAPEPGRRGADLRNFLVSI
jgi:hypothetical protein